MADKVARGRHLQGAREAGLRRRGKPNRHAQGERNWQAKLTREKVFEIRREIAAVRDLQSRGFRGGGGLAAIARKHGVSDSLVRGIESGRNWGWLQRPAL